jgi:assimilatory nitrate reductase catalytic subunit
MEAVRTTCPYCGVGCGITVTPTGPRAATIKGDSAHPANAGKLCSKGTHLGETISLEGRLLEPLVHGAQASWDAALELVARTFKATIEQHGPDSVAFYVSGQLLTEDYYVANKLMKGFIGSGNIDTNSRLCMSSAVAAHVRSFGEDIVPGTYGDIDEADLIILVGSNTAWCHPILYQRIMRAKETRGCKLVVIDPRRTETAETADLHLALKPGSDVALFNALLAQLYWHDALNDRYLEHINVPDNFWQNLSAMGDPIAYAARECELPVETIGQFFSLFEDHEKSLTMFSQGINQSSHGTDKATSIINVHLATGRIGKAGCSVFSVTGQPNAMGGREVGGLATTLAAHMDFAPDNVDCVSRFWNTPQIANAPGLKAVDMFQAVKSGKIKAIWIMSTNPVVSMPNASDVRAALSACPFVVVSDCMAATDTTAFAHILLPAAAWGEKNGTVTNSDRTISRQRAFMAAPGNAKPDWWQLAKIGEYMGWPDSFDYESPADIFREHAALSGFENTGARLFDISSHQDISNQQYEQLAPFIWGKKRYFAEGIFPTSSGHAQLVSLSYQPPAHASNAAYPLALNTGRLRDQWHSMTRTGQAASLLRHRMEPTVEISPRDAEKYQLSNGDLAEISTAFGKQIFRVLVSASQRRGDIFIPIHWNNSNSSGGKAGMLVNAATDRYSGQPEFKHTPAQIVAVRNMRYGLLLSDIEIDICDMDYWTRIRMSGGFAYEFATTKTIDALKLKLLPRLETVQFLESVDQARNIYRSIALKTQKCTTALFVSDKPITVSRPWLFDQFSEKSSDVVALLAGRARRAEEDCGELVCVCFNIGAQTISRAIQDKQLTTVEDIATVLRAGSNCGSCRPILSKLLQEKVLADAA